MSRIKITDLTDEQKKTKLTAKEMKRVTGGKASVFIYPITYTTYTAHNKPKEIANKPKE